MDTRLGFIFAFASLAILHSTNAISKDYLAKVVAAKDKCQKEFNVDDSVIGDFIKKNIKPESESGKCMVACFMEERGMMEDGKIISERVKSDNKEKWEDPTHVDKGNQVTDICDKEVPNTETRDKCLVATDYVMCMVKHGDEVGLPQVDFAHPTDR